MDPLTGALIGMGSGLMSGALGLAGTSSANQMSQQEVVQQEQFQETMADSQYQRGVQDLQKAGLNPMLAYMSSAAPSPQGATPTVQNPGPGMQQAVATAVSTAQQQEQLSLNQASTQADVVQKLAAAKNTGLQSNLLSNTLGAKTQSAQLEERMFKTFNAILDKINLSPSGASNVNSMIDRAIDWGVNKLNPYESPLGMGTLGNTPMPSR